MRDYRIRKKIQKDGTELFYIDHWEWFFWMRINYSLISLKRAQDIIDGFRRKDTKIISTEIIEY